MNMEKDLISIIIPVYNVERYLESCVTSVLNQSYKKIEVILVDDGSTDSSAKICNNLAEVDERIEVFHKKNGGLSDARNFGIKKAKGKYITFIDSDDVVSVNYLEALYNALVASNVKLSVCDLTAFKDGTQVVLSKSKIKEQVILNAEAAFKEMLLQRKFGVSACGKLIDVECLRDVEFPYHRLYEDMATTYKWVENALEVVFVDADLYFYRKRKNSITTAKFNEKKLDIFLSFGDFESFIYEKYPKLIKYCEYRKLDCSTAILEEINKEEENRIIRKTMIKNIKENFLPVILNSDVPIKKKTKIILARINDSLFRKVMHLYNE